MLRDEMHNDVVRRQPTNPLRVQASHREPLLPKHLRCVNQFLETHIHENLCADDLASAAGTSVRSLYAHFQEFIGTSPMEYVRSKRLERVREALLYGQGSNVSSIAMQLGFNHLGRFSIDYKKRFGESPSQTLKFARLKID